MTIPAPEREIRNAVDEAVYFALGGVRDVAKRLDCATQSVYEHIGRGLIRNREVALEYERLTREAGHPVPAAELMALVPWEGPSRMGDPTKRKRRGKGSAASASPTVTRIGQRADAASVQAKGKHICPTCHKSACNKFCNPVDSFVPEYKRTGTEG